MEQEHTPGCGDRLCRPLSSEGSPELIARPACSSTIKAIQTRHVDKGWCWVNAKSECPVLETTSAPT